MTTKLPVKTKTEELLPSAAVRGAYDVKLTPDATARLKEIEEYRAYAVEQAGIASKISVKDDASNTQGSEVVVNLTKARKYLEDLQKFFTSPLESRKKLVIAVFKKILEDATGQEDRLRHELSAYFQKKENERIAAENKRIADQQETERKARMLGRAAPKPIAAPPAPELARSTQTENGAAGITMEWGGVVTDPAQVPKKYWAINQKLIDADVRAGVREIPGVLISQTPSVRVR